MKSSKVEIEKTLFEAASGKVRGTVIAMMDIKGQPKRIAHATLLVDEAPDVVLDIPKRLPLDSFNTLADGLRSFHETVAELDAQ